MALLTKKWAFLLSLTVFVVISVALVKLQPTMQHDDLAKKPVPVSVITLKPHMIAPTITGYGVVEPNVLLNVKLEVSGMVTYVHPKLRKGELISEGTLVLTVDDRDYQLALKQAKADVAVTQANLRELDANLNDVKVNLELVKEKLTLSNKELLRKQKLLSKRSISQSAVDSQKSAVIQLKQEVQSLKIQLDTLPAQRDVLVAKIVIAEASVETQQRNVERTKIAMPFNGRITQLSVEKNQFVAQGTSLFSTQTIDKVLINVQFPVERFHSLAKSMRAPGEGAGGLSFEKAVLMIKTSAMFEMLGIEAEVRLPGAANIRWPAKVERISDELDPSTRTLGIMVSVENPYKDVNPGVRPPLIAQMYTEVVIRSRPQPFYVIPRDALHEGSVYMLSSATKMEKDTSNETATHESIEAKNALAKRTLVKKSMKPDYQFGSIALFKNGLSEGQQVIVSDLFPAVSGMALHATTDDVMERSIQQWVEGQ